MVYIEGKTEKCCVCGSIATNWTGWLRKSRDGVVAGFCDEHKKTGKVYQTFGMYNLFGYYDKTMGLINSKKNMNGEVVRKKYGLHKNIIEQ